MDVTGATAFVRADVATEAGVRAAVDAACGPPGRIGVLVNSAGGIEDPCFPAADPAKWGSTNAVAKAGVRLE